MSAGIIPIRSRRSPCYRARATTIVSPALTIGFVVRVRAVKAILDEVYPKPLDDWVKGFELDGNPERELLLWECIALAYRTFTEGRTLSMEAKEEALQITLQCSLGRTEEHLLKGERKVLHKVDVLGLVDCYRAAAEAISAITQGREAK